MPVSEPTSGENSHFAPPSSTSWRRERLLHIGSSSTIHTIPAWNADHHPQGDDSPSTPPPTDAGEAARLNSSAQKQSYGTLPTSSLNRHLQSFTARRGLSNLPGLQILRTKTNTNSSPPSPTFSLLSSQRPISAYDAALRDDVEGDADVRINGIRVWYSSFTSIDWLHDAIKDSVRFARLRRRRSIRAKIRLLLDRGIGWFIVTIVGLCTAVVAFLIVRSEQWLFDLKGGYCAAAWYKSKSFCCFQTEKVVDLNLGGLREIQEICPSWRTWPEVFSQEGKARGVVEYLSYSFIAVSLCCSGIGFGTEI